MLLHPVHSICDPDHSLYYRADKGQTADARISDLSGTIGFAYSESQLSGVPFYRSDGNLRKSENQAIIVALSLNGTKKCNRMLYQTLSLDARKESPGS